MRLNPYDPQFEPVFMGGQDRRPRQRMTGGNQPAQPPYAGNFPMTGGNFPAMPVPGMNTGGPAQQAPWMGMQTGGRPAQPGMPMQQTGGFLPSVLRQATMGGPAQMGQWPRWRGNLFGGYR